MPSPFPGMDPYLELPERWPDFHTRLIVELANTLTRRLRPRYIVAVEQRTYLLEGDDLAVVGRPDVAVVDARPDSGGPEAAPAGAGAPRVVTLALPEEVRERYLEVREVPSGEVVTVIEILSPANKLSGAGRKQYQKKRRAVLGSSTSLVEIDLLRSGRSLSPKPAAKRSAYAILVARSSRLPHADLYEFGVRDPIPTFSLPLRRGESEPAVALKPLLDAVYDAAGYELRIDYDQPPVAPLADPDAAWARALVAEVRQRRGR